MEISVTDAEGHLMDLVLRAEGGEDIVLTWRGRPAVRLAPVTPMVTRSTRRKLMADAQRSGVAKAVRVDDDAGNHAFLYDDEGLPK
jgi:prevent-host-death family protein